MDYQGKTICCALRDSVLEVELHRAPCNEIGLETLDELEVLADYIQSASSLPPLVIYSSLQSGFCAGADLKALYHFLSDAHTAEEKQVALEQVRDFLNRIHRVFNIIDSAPTTTIAALHGPVFGGGFELALTCDVMVADASSRFCFPELRLGLVPGFGGLPRLGRDLGNAVVRDLLFSGRSLNAKRAYELGLVSQRLAKGEALSAARALAQQCARFSKHTVRQAKQFVKALPLEELEQEKELFCKLMMEPTVFEALQSFVTRNDLRPYLP